MSSARDDQPDTVPPPAGEEDAYSAATKVGAMPAELMARLRAEGLLPEDDAVDDRPPPPRPGSALTPRPAPPPPPGQNPFDDVPELTSDPPPGYVSSVPAGPVTAPPPGPEAFPFPPHEQHVPGAVTSRPPAPPPPIETPIAFVTPPSSAPLAAPQDSSPAPESAADAARAFRGRSRMQSIALLVAIVLALVAFAFVMALLSQRR